MRTNYALLVRDCGIDEEHEKRSLTGNCTKIVQFYHFFIIIALTLTINALTT